MAEPSVLTEDVRIVLRRAVRPDLDDSGDPVAMIAEKADTSNRTVYRVLGGESDTISLDLADRLLNAVGAHLNEVRVVLTTGETVDYWSAP